MSGTQFDVAVFLGLGLVLGAIHAGLLYRAVMLLPGRLGMAASVLLNAARIGFAVVGFWFLAQFGAVALIAATAGFTLALFSARFVVINRNA